MLIKAVANATTTFPMMCFLFPKKTCQGMDNIILNFWWGQKENEDRIHWRNWKSLSKSKHSRGLGFKDFL